ncbi:MAG: HTH domain-containing protein, partial [Thermococcus sp.]|nr:HTH domain-containing protein [Thermococcus sp.]
TSTPDRRKLLAHVLSLFDYNPRVLNISELARIFNVSRDTIYHDIQQILKEKGK